MVLLAVMWRQYCNKPSAKIIDKMAVFENCEGRQTVDGGKFEPRGVLCVTFEVSECSSGIWC